MTSSRMLGRNIELSLQEKDISKESFARQMQYSESDVARLFEGRLTVFPDDLQEIAKLLQTSPDILREPRSLKDYKIFSDCRGEFSEGNREDRILDLFDAYIELEEALKK